MGYANRLVIVALLLNLFATPVWSDLLYDNGPMGKINGANIGQGFEVTEPFNLINESTLSALQVGLFTGGSPPKSLSWTIGDVPFGNSYGSGAGILENLFAGPAMMFNAWESTFSLPSTTLGAGTYWLTLSSASVYPVLWSVNNGPSAQSFQKFTGGDLHTYGSNSLQIYGSTSVPEPAMLFFLGTGLLGLWGLTRKI